MRHHCQSREQLSMELGNALLYTCRNQVKVLHVPCSEDTRFAILRETYPEAQCMAQDCIADNCILWYICHYHVMINCSGFNMH